MNPDDPVEVKEEAEPDPEKGPGTPWRRIGWAAGAIAVVSLAAATGWWIVTRQPARKPAPNPADRKEPSEDERTW